MSSIAVIIVNYNTKDLLLQCLASIPDRQAMEIIVVDNASVDGSVAALREEFPHVRVVASEENLGFARANNLGVNQTNAKTILLLNPDTLVKPGAIATMVKFLDENPLVGIVSPRLLDQDGAPQASIGDFPSVLGSLLDKPLALIDRLWGHAPKVLGLLGQVSAKYRIPSLAAEVKWVSGAALCCRRDLWDVLGGFDEGFFMYYEDVDLCFRARREGWQVCYLPSAEIVHLVGRSQEKGSAVKNRIHFASQSYFFRKNYGKGQALLLEIVRWPYRILNLRTRINRDY